MMEKKNVNVFVIVVANISNIQKKIMERQMNIIAIFIK